MARRVPKLPPQQPPLMGISALLGLRDPKLAAERARLDAQRNKLLSVLSGGLWHTTNPSRFSGILKVGAILPEPPDIPDTERWKATRGPEYYPYVRTLRGVSLFDFDQFDPERYEQCWAMSNWREFVPYQPKWGEAVWIEIDRAQVQSSLISTTDLLARQRSEHAGQHLLMPLIEAAHIGPIPRAAFKRALLVQKGKTRFRRLTLP